MNTWVPSRFVVGFGLFISLVFCVVLCFVFVLCLVCTICQLLIWQFSQILYSFVYAAWTEMWRTRVTCFKDNHILGKNVCPYLHVQHEQIISLPFHEDRHNYCLSRIASSYDSSSYTHTTMFWLLPFYLLTYTYHIWDEGVLLSDGGWGSITTMWPLISRSNWFLWAFSCQRCNLFLSSDIDLRYLVWMCATSGECVIHNHDLHVVFDLKFK